MYAHESERRLNKWCNCYGITNILESLYCQEYCHCWISFLLNLLLVFSWSGSLYFWSNNVYITYILFISAYSLWLTYILSTIHPMNDFIIYDFQSPQWAYIIIVIWYLYVYYLLLYMDNIKRPHIIFDGDIRSLFLFFSSQFIIMARFFTQYYILSSVGSLWWWIIAFVYIVRYPVSILHIVGLQPNFKPSCKIAHFST